MRLLNAKTGELEDFTSEDDVPSYAILSHTWSKDEISYHDWNTLSPSEIDHKEGGKKIKYTRRQATRDGLEWVWIDTCCIDKASSAELSEAINSMFRWYRNAVVCYVYLADVSVPTEHRDDIDFESELRQSRWFTRGWTLQELIAPSAVLFYSEEWTLVGTKTELSDLISSITRIDEKYLLGEDVGQASIAQRMSWASRRKTSRTEDIAYCLLGLFGVNIPLLYGEGSQAFQRLQEALMKIRPEDHTLFAWGEVVEDGSWIYKQDQAWSDVPPQWEDTREPPGVLGLLASSPKDFENSGQFVPSLSASEYYRNSIYQAPLPAGIGDSTIRISLPVLPRRAMCLRRWPVPRITQSCGVCYAILLCGREGDYNGTVVLPLEGHNASFLSRSRKLTRCKDTYSSEPLKRYTTSLIVGPPPRFSLRPNTIIIRRRMIDRSIASPSTIPVKFAIGSGGHFLPHANVIHNEILSGEICLFSYDMEGSERGFNISIGRVPNDTKYGSSIHVGLIPFKTQQTTKDAAPEVADGIKWHLVIRPGTTPIFGRTLECPADDWILDKEPFPRIFVRVEKMILDESKNTYVDVLDLIVKRRRPTTWQQMERDRFSGALGD